LVSLIIICNEMIREESDIVYTHASWA